MKFLLRFLSAMLWLLLPATAMAQTAYLENPQPGSFQSGIGVISGWSCNPGVDVLIDGVVYRPAYGTVRPDAAYMCGGNANVGFGLLYSYNGFGNGAHTAQLRINGLPVGAPAAFTVTVPTGDGFITGATKTVQVADFPYQGQTTTLVWQQAMQNFAISQVSSPAAPGYPISFLGLNLNAMAYTSEPYAMCDATLWLTNTLPTDVAPHLVFDIVANGISLGHLTFPPMTLKAGLPGQLNTTVFNPTSLAPMSCGSFTLRFNAGASTIN